jgi:pimeloyl-ACP methyl ester carboxylesterase
MRMMRAIALAGTALLATSLVGPPATAQPTALEWHACTTAELDYTGPFECARLEVPMDRNDPAGPTFSLAVARHRSTGGPGQRLGSLFFNPGGPGGSGVEALPSAWAILPPQVQDRYDLVTWDPRGVGKTTPAPRACPFPSGDVDLPDTGPVDWATVGTQITLAIAPAHAACASENAQIISHLSTNEAVADLEALRTAVGDARLNYLGWSYGTRIGYDYAVTHPELVGAMVLDSPMFPGAWTIDRGVQSALAPGQSYDVFAQYYPKSNATYDRVMRALEAAPVVLPGDVVLSRWSVPDFVSFFTASQSAYPLTARIIDKLDDAVLGSGEDRAAAQAWLSVRLSGLASALSPADSWWVPSAIWCLDTAARPAPAELLPSTQLLEAEWSSSEALGLMATAGVCSGYPFASDPVPAALAGAAPAPAPMLVVGSRWDGRTFGGWIDPMTSALVSARSITYRGGQHVVFGTIGSTCVDDAVTRYLLTRRLPSQDLTCPTTFEIGQLVP